MAKRKPIAFMSYVRFNDHHDNGKLTEFCKRLSGEVRAQTGKDFPIFQDRNEINWGQNWRQRIKESTDEVTFLIAIITPSFFESDACKDELQRFLAREKKLNRNDLILPVYYIDCPLLNDEKKRAADPLAEAIASRQYTDWRELRFEPLTSPQVGRTLEQLAVQIRGALEQIQASRRNTESRVSQMPERVTGRRARPTGTTDVSVFAEPERGPSAKTEPPTLVVEPMRRLGYSTIGEAIAAAKPGDRILVRPGFYQEGLVIDKPLEVIGDGDVSKIVVHATGKDAVLFKTTMGRLSNLTIRQMGGGLWYAVNIAQGRLELEECDISTQALSCVEIHGGADPHLRRNRIHDGNQFGVYVHHNGLGTLEDNEIFGNAFGGVAIKSGGNPTLRRNRINRNRFEAIWIRGGGGTFEDNDLRGNGRGAWSISRDSEPNVMRSRNLE